MSSAVDPPSTETLVDPTRPAAELRAGVPTVAPGDVGRYAMGELLGAGGMGAVYAAHDRELDRKVAVKLLHPKLRSSRTAQERLHREARAMARLAHRNIVAVYDVGQIDDTVFIAMELIEGSTLRAWCNAEDRSWRDVLAVYRKAGRGLAAAHEAGIVHRDFKPDNVLIGDDGRVAVSDFGVARALSVADATESAISGATTGDRLTRTDGIIGTPAYMAPEQRAGGAVDGRTDQFGFCVALWEALYRARPFASAVPQLGPPVPPARTKVPARIGRALVRGLALDPAQRWPSMTALLRALEVTPKRRGLVVAAAAVLAFAAGGAALGLVRSPAAPTCRGAEAKLASVWFPARQQVIRAAFAATGMSFAADVTRRVEADLDDWTGAWSREHVAACEATRVHGEQSEVVLDRRMECLARRLRGLDDLLGAFEHATPAAVERARASVAALRSPAECADLEALAQAYPAPRDPAQARRVTEVEAQIARVDALLIQGEHRAARAAANAAVADARALHHPPLLASALSSLGHALIMLSDGGASIPIFEEAIDQAELARDDAQRAALSLEVAHALYMIDRVDDAERQLVAASAILERSGNAEAQRAAAAVLRAEIAAWRLQNGDAEVALREALTRAKALGPRGTELTFRVIDAWVRLWDGQFRANDILMLRAVELSLAEDYYGGQHPRAAECLALLANAYLVRSKPGDVAMAVPLLERALAIQEQRLGSEHPSLGYTINALAMARRRQGGDLGEALVAHRRAARLIEAAEGPQSDALAWVLRSIGFVHMKRGEPADAVAVFERARTIIATHIVVPRERADLDFMLARALWESGQDRRRAQSLMKGVLPVYIGIGSDAARRRAATERWRAAPGRYQPDSVIGM